MNEVIIGALVDGYFAACDRLIDLPDRNDIIKDVTKALKKWVDNEPSDYYAELIQTRVDEGIKAYEDAISRNPIFHEFVIKDDETAQRLIDAMEEARTAKKRIRKTNPNAFEDGEAILRKHSRRSGEGDASGQD